MRVPFERCATSRSWCTKKCDSQSMLANRKLTGLLFDGCMIACALIQPWRMTRRAALPCACQRHGGRSYAQKEQKAILPQDRSEAPGSRSRKIRGTQQPQFAPFKEKLPALSGPLIGENWGAAMPNCYASLQPPGQFSAELVCSSIFVHER